MTGASSGADGKRAVCRQVKRKRRLRYKSYVLQHPSQEKKRRKTKKVSVNAAP